jgi:RNA polymerase sigma-70 factor (ECF subfamily)
MRERPRADDRERRFEQSFQDSWVATFRFALAWTNDWSEAEDLAQEAFSRLWAKRDTVDWSKPMLPWLLQVTRRLATDRFRRLRRISPLSDRRTEGLDSDARLRWLDVQAAVGILPPAQRAALVLVTVVGLDVKEAAIVLGTTDNALRASISRARSRLGER